MRLLAAAMGMVIAVIGIVGIASPSDLIAFGRALQTPGALYIVTAIRVIFGAILLWIASGSRMPITLRIIGILIIVASLFAAVFGLEHSQALLDLWSSRDPSFMRTWAAAAVVFGLFIAYAVGSSRRGAG
jgi:hypothetical protein